MSETDRLERPIFTRFPSLVDTQAWAALATLPTPVRALDSSGRTWVKCDNELHPLYGGNKTRKLECIVGEWRAQGIREVVSVGGTGTNAGLAIALQAHLEGLACRIITFAQPLTPSVIRNLRAMQGLGARVEHYRSVEAAGLRFHLHPLRLQPKVCFLPGGAATPSAVLAYVNAALELNEQVQSGQLPMPEEICLAAGSGSSLAGLTLGCAIAGMRTRVIGVRVFPESAFAGLVKLCNVAVVKKQMLAAAAILGWRGEIPRARMVDAVGPGYGVPLTQTHATIELFQQRHDIALDATYSGKAATWLLQRQTDAAATLLFWNTYNSRPLADLPQAKSIFPLPTSLERKINPEFPATPCMSLVNSPVATRR